MHQLKPIKDVDSAARSRFMKVASWTFPTIGLIGLMAGGGIVISLIAGSIGTVITFLIIEHVGSSSINLLYGKRKPIYSDYETFEGPLNQARLHKSKKEYHYALVLVNAVLKDAPNLPEALYLKAQVLSEGYHKGEESIMLLKEIIEILPDGKEPLNKWSRTLIDEIKKSQPKSGHTT